MNGSNQEVDNNKSSSDDEALNSLDPPFPQHKQHNRISFDIESFMCSRIFGVRKQKSKQLANPTKLSPKS